MEKKVKKTLILIAVLLLLTSYRSNSRAAEVKPKQSLRIYSDDKNKKRIQVDELYLVKTRIQNDLKLPDDKITMDEVLDWMKLQQIYFEFRVDGNLATVYNSRVTLFTWEMKKPYIDNQKRQVVEYLVKQIYNYNQLPGIPKY